MKIKLQLLAAFLAAAALNSEGRGTTFHGHAATGSAGGASTSASPAIYFSSGTLAGQGGGATMREQAAATLKRLEENIGGAGFARKDVVFVRAYLVPGAGGQVDYAGWNEAWNEFFRVAQNSPRPPLTTVAVPFLGRAGVLIEIEFVCAGAAKPDLFAGSDKLGLTVRNPMLKPYGTREGRIYNGVGVKPAAAYYWTAGITPPMLKADAPATSPEQYGDMKTQATGLLRRLQENLAAVGLSFEDVVFLRAFVGPDTLRGGGFDYDGWNAAYGEFFSTAASPHKPARTTVTTPTYGSTGMMLEVELLAAFPAVPTKVAFDNPAAPALKAFGSAGSPISSGVAAKAGSALYFSAGIGPQGGGDLKAQASSALGTLKERLAAAGLGLRDVAFLRAYVVPAADGSIDRRGWNEAYAAFFNNSEQPHKPARTTIAVHSLPDPAWKIIIDVVAISP